MDDPDLHVYLGGVVEVTESHHQVAAKLNNTRPLHRRRPIAARTSAPAPLGSLAPPHRRRPNGCVLEFAPRRRRRRCILQLLFQSTTRSPLKAAIGPDAAAPSGGDA